ncbi:ATP-binding cassette domain-containing protein, partial [Escherichia sp. TWPC-MK]
ADDDQRKVKGYDHAFLLQAKGDGKKLTGDDFGATEIKRRSGDRFQTVVRNVILSGYFDSIGIYQAVSDRQQKLVQQWLDILGIDKRTADAPFHSLSWGQQRLALIVRALVKHPTLLILDEPLQGLDPLNRQLIRRFVDVLISEGETQLLFVSHHAEDAPACITHRLEFVPDGGLYRYVLTKIY